MGLSLFLQTSTGEEPPLWFTATDSRDLLRHIGALRANDERSFLVQLVRAAGLDPELLTRVVGAQEEPLESFLQRDPTEERRISWLATHAEREAAWQAPQALVTLLQALIASLPNTGTPEDEYFSGGEFQQDLQDLLEMLVWSQGAGIARVRLVYG
jgi:hypothetical protein